MNTKISQSVKDFQRDAKKYVINMLRGSSRTLHIKNGCYWGERIHEYIDFDTLEEAESCGVRYEKCKNCFKINGE